jgi:O-antigen/teichoic acid export membrane protein
MSQLKSLAGQTAIYGVSSILGRLINYALVPLHTMVFPNPEQLGVVTGLYAYTAIFMVIYTFGMETAFFRYARKDAKSAYHLTSTAVIIISTFFSLLLFAFSSPLASIIGYPETGQFIQWIALILWIDAVLAIPFAKLRYENKAKKFALAKIINILLNILLQVTFLLLLPYLYNIFSPGSQVPDLGIGFIFLANLIANGALFIILFSEIRQLKLQFHWVKFKPILIYATPILIMGVAGMFNEQLDKILLEHLLPDDFYNNMDSTAALGVYGQTFKLGIFMMLAIQAFRYAGEPFFFAKAEDKNAPELFAKVMHYFIISGLLLFVLVSINVDLIGQLFLRSPAYRVALYLVPLMLLGKLLYGVYLNLSIWFKLSDKTVYGTYFSVLGVVITVLGNIILIPIIGFMGCVISVIACYTVMAIACYYYGQKYYPIPYKFGLLIPYVLISLVLVYSLDRYHYSDINLDYAFRIILSGLIVGSLYLFEKRKLKAKNT